MNDAVQSVSDVLENIKGYGGWATSLVVSVLYWYEKRQGRDGDRIKSLFEENVQLRADMTALEAKHDRYRKACEKETDELRAEVRALVTKVDGLVRQIVAQSVAAARAVPINPSPVIDRAMDSVVAIIGDPAHPGGTP